MARTYINKSLFVKRDIADAMIGEIDILTKNAGSILAGDFYH